MLRARPSDRYFRGEVVVVAGERLRVRCLGISVSAARVIFGEREREAGGPRGGNEAAE